MSSTAVSAEKSDQTPAPKPAMAKRGPVAGVTPMMEQFLAIKEAHQDCILFYRMGDFYELFFDDAVQAAAALDITLTKRGKHLGEDIPMCGVPVHSSESYLEKLIAKGFRVAICEQTEDPKEAKKRGAKAVVKRDVVRIVTPGTITEDNILDRRAHNFLAAIAQPKSENDITLSWVDLSTGDIGLTHLGPAGLSARLAALAPSEILIAERLGEELGPAGILDDWHDQLTVLAPASFSSTSAESRIASAFGVATLDGFGDLSRGDVSALGALIDYLTLTQKGAMPHLKPPAREDRGAVMAMDAATRRNLELTRTLSGETRGSLLQTIDKTITGPGGRLLAGWLAAPLTDAPAITARHDGVQWMLDQNRVMEDVRGYLKAAPDLARALNRLALDRGGPRDLAALRDGMMVGFDLRDLLQKQDQDLAPLPALLKEQLTALSPDPALADLLTAALDEDLPLMARDGGFIKAGWHPPLDELKTLRDDSRKIIVGLETRYREETGIQSLKVRHNKVFGYYVEVTARYGDQLMAPPLSDTFMHRQTLANAVRFTTVELSDLETKLNKAADGALALELDLFTQLRDGVLAQAPQLHALGDGLALIDVICGLANQAQANRWCRPVIDDSRTFTIKAGRHPVVEAALRKDGDTPFIANDCGLAEDGNDAAVWLLTGPNMAGKSTFLRQNALIAVLAQMGSFVPADEAHIGIVDRLFSRVGAADDLARGRSTFMVEMVETAAILNQAGPNALVILDEIGRGTATFDGLSIAWATLEHLHDVNGTRALFATHYHELTALSEKLSGLSNHTMRVTEFEGDVIFLHEVMPGAADRSYGLQVAKLAGLPDAVIGRAGQVLSALEEGDQGPKAADLADDLPLFSSAPRPASAPTQAAGPMGPAPAEQALHDLNPDDLTPREALDKLYELKKLLTDG